MIERASTPTETEKTFVPRRDAILEQFRSYTTQYITQPYLSHPDEPHSLRLRHTASELGGKTDATLKDRGTIVGEGLARIEVEAPISESRFSYYQQTDKLPRITKIRRSPIDAIDIDYYPGGYTHIESEDPAAWNRFLDEFHLSDDDFIDVTGAQFADNEWRAHYHYRLNHGGRDAWKPAPPLDLSEIETDILGARGEKPTLVALGGRSGSGKSTIIKQLQTRFAERGISTATISTDDYNHGKTILHALSGGTWENYDSNNTYDLPLCQAHLALLATGTVVPQYQFDFKTEERVVNGKLQPADVVFVEGIKAHHPDIRELADLYYEMPTSLATSIGRRIMRDLTERPRFDPSANLAYYLEYAEPEYQALL